MLSSSYKIDVSVKVKCNKNPEEQYFPNKLQNQGKNTSLYFKQPVSLSKEALPW